MSYHEGVSAMLVRSGSTSHPLQPRPRQLQVPGSGCPGPASGLHGAAGCRCYVAEAAVLQAQAPDRVPALLTVQNEPL